MNTNSDKQFNSIDLAKFIASILVVMIHIQPFPITTYYTIPNTILSGYVGKVAVPFFFISSGYLFYNKQNVNTFRIADCKKYIQRLLVLYLVWTILYLPLTIKNMLPHNVSLAKVVLIYLRNFLFVGSYHHLWYLPALIFSILVTAIFFSKKVSPIIILLISFAFYLIGLLFHSYYGVLTHFSFIAPRIYNYINYFIDNIIVTSRNGLFEGFFFVSIGLFFATTNIKIKLPVSISLLIVSATCLVAEINITQYYRLSKMQDILFFLAPTAFFLFDIIRNIEIKESPIFKLLRSLSSLIFFLHLWVYKLLSDFFTTIHADTFFSYTRFWATIITTCLLSYLIIVLSKTKPFRFLKKIY